MFGLFNSKKLKEQNLALQRDFNRLSKDFSNVQYENLKLREANREYRRVLGDMLHARSAYSLGQKGIIRNVLNRFENI